MKVCFPVAVNKGIESKVYNHFGSSPMFAVVDSESETAEVLDNSNAHHIHGACNPILALGGKKADAVVVGGIGAGALSKLNAMGLKVFEAVPGTIKKNLELFRKGDLKELDISHSCSDHGHEHDHGHGHSCHH